MKKLLLLILACTIFLKTPVWDISTGSNLAMLKTVDPEKTIKTLKQSDSILIRGYSYSPEEVEIFKIVCENEKKGGE